MDGLKNTRTLGKVKRAYAISKAFGGIQRVLIDGKLVFFRNQGWTNLGAMQTLYTFKVLPREVDRHDWWNGWWVENWKFDDWSWCYGMEDIKTRYEQKR